MWCVVIRTEDGRARFVSAACELGEAWSLVQELGEGEVVTLEEGRQLKNQMLGQV